MRKRAFRKKFTGIVKFGRKFKKQLPPPGSANRRKKGIGNFFEKTLDKRDTLWYNRKVAG